MLLCVYQCALHESLKDPWHDKFSIWHPGDKTLKCTPSMYLALVQFPKYVLLNIARYIPDGHENYWFWKLPLARVLPQQSRIYAALLPWYFTLNHQSYRLRTHKWGPWTSQAPLSSSTWTNFKWSTPKYDNGDLYYMCRINRKKLKSTNDWWYSAGNWEVMRCKDSLSLNYCFLNYKFKKIFETAMFSQQACKMPETFTICSLELAFREAPASPWVGCGWRNEDIVHNLLFLFLGLGGQVWLPRIEKKNRLT